MARTEIAEPRHPAPAPTPMAAAGPAAPPDGATTRSAVRPRLLPLAVVALVGMLSTAVLAFAAARAHERNEERLLVQRVDEAAAVIEAAVPATRRPLASAAEIAAATDGDRVAFERYVAPLVGQAGVWTSASLWHIEDPAAGPLVVVGDDPVLAELPPAEIAAHFDDTAATAATDVMSVLDLLTRDRIGYTATTARGPATWVVHAEQQLVPDRRSQVQEDDAFSDLHHAMYLGDTDAPAELVASSDVDNLPLRGRTASATVPFGDTDLLLVMSPRGELGGMLLARLPWAILVVGTLVTAGAAALTGRLERQKAQAESLAAENARLYGEQRSLAQTLQRSLLPDALPNLARFEFAARYEPGAAGVDIGGDWYDVMTVDEDRVLVAVGDVSGRGVDAVAAMATLRYAIRAYAAHGDAPETILAKLEPLLHVQRDGHFATVLCGVVDQVHGTVTLASAGHPNPVLVTGDVATIVAVPPGVPVGVPVRAPYRAVTLPLRAGATLLAFSDGLFERRGEDIDRGMDNVRDAAGRPHNSLDDLLAQILRTLAGEGSEDDIALLGVRWLG